MRRLLAPPLVLVLVLFCTAHSALAAPQTGAPPELEVWRGWVLQGQETRLCPRFYNDPNDQTCLFPARLSLDVSDSGGVFEMLVAADAETFLVLPHAPGVWPEAVVDGVQSAVVDHQGKAAVLVKPGRHSIKGKLVWNVPPREILVDPALALVDLKRDGVPVPSPDVQPGRIRPFGRVEAAKPEDRLEVKVARLVRDSRPAQIVTHITLDVGGGVRKIELPGVLPENGTPYAVKTPVALSFGERGSLSVQAGQGRYEIETTSRLEAPFTRLGPIKTPFGREIWTFEPDAELRDVEIKPFGGASGVDARAVDLPEAWRGFRAYVMDSGAGLEVVELHRGEPAVRGDNLNARRHLWLDFNGRGITARDEISGEAKASRTLKARAEGSLGRATVNGEDQSIVEIGPDKRAGVILRSAAPNITAEIRYDDFGGRIPAGGFETDFKSLALSLNTPPGWKLFTAKGPDRVEDSWFGKWNLWSIFWTLLLVLSAWRARSIPTALVALFWAVLAWHEPGAPTAAFFTPLILMACLGFLERSERFQARVGLRRTLLWLYGAALFLITLAGADWAVRAARTALHPQLQPQYGMSQFVGEATAPALAPAPAPESKSLETGRMDAAKPKGGAARKAPATLSLSESDESRLKDKQALMIDPDALVQTGPGVPDWRWKTYALSYNGPVDKTAMVELWLISPTMERLLTALRLALFVGLLLMCLQSGFAFHRSIKATADDGKPGDKPTSPAAPAAAIAAGLLALIFSGPAVAGDIPSPEMLSEYQKRLFEPESCKQSCVSIPGMEIRAERGELRITLVVHAETEIALPLPQLSEDRRPQLVLLDEKEATKLFKKGKSLRLAVPKGVHRIVLLHALPEAASFTVDAPLRPKRATVLAPDFVVQGVSSDGAVEGPVQLSRIKRDGGFEKSGKDRETYIVNPFLHVERTLTLGLTWEIETVVTRLTPVGEPVVGALQLLPGETVLTKGVAAKDGAAVISLDARSRSLRFNSRLEVAPKIELAASKTGPWIETWRLNASPVWNLNLSGSPIIQSFDPSGRFNPVWKPRSGETATIQVERPKTASGAAMTIERVDYIQSLGERLDEHTLKLRIRSAKAGRHAVTVPPGAENIRLFIGGRELSGAGGAPGEVGFPLSPGLQEVDVQWRSQAGDRGLRLSGAAVDLKAPAVNIHHTMRLPQDSWVLFLFADSFMGPAVKFWSYLAVFMLIAAALGFLPGSPVRRAEWFVLSLGLTQVEPALAFLAVAWLPVLGLKRRLPAKRPDVYNLVQVGSALLVLIGLVALFEAIRTGLLGLPEMQIAGNQSHAHQLQWTFDRTDGPLPKPTVIAATINAYRVFMLLWSLWMAYMLLKWLKWGFESFGEGGWWKAQPPRPHSPAQAKPSVGKNVEKTPSTEERITALLKEQTESKEDRSKTGA